MCRSGGASKHNFWTARSWCRELSIGIYMSQIGRGAGGGGVQSFWDPPSKILLGHSYEILSISSESSAQAQSIGTLLGQIGLRWGGPVDVSNSQRHTRSGAGRRVSQANGAAIHSKLPGLCQHEIVSRTMRKFVASLGSSVVLGSCWSLLWFCRRRGALSC